MEKLIRKKTLLMSLFMGIIMGTVFTVTSQLKNQGRIIIMGLITSIIISVVISCILGLIIPMKTVNEKVCEKMNIDPESKIKALFATSFVDNLIFTPLNCIINMWYGMAMSLKDLPPDVVNPFQRMGFCLQLPYFVPALISTLLIDLAIGYVLCLIASYPLDRLTNSMCGQLGFRNS